MLSLTMQLELTLEMPGVDTSPIDMAPMGISQPTSMTSGVFRQAITLAKPWGRVGGHLNAKSLAGGGDASGNGAFNKQSGGIIGIVQVSCLVLPFDFGILAGLGISLVATLARMGVILFPTWHTLELSSPALALVLAAPQGLWWCQEYG